MSQAKNLYSNNVVAESPFDSGEFEPGHVLGGRYKVVNRLGRGGMGVVYRVKQFFLDKEMALKTIDKQHISDTAIRRFQQEARTAFAIDHPNVIEVTDFGLLDDDTPFLVMELLEGETLGEKLKKVGRLKPDELISIFIQVCFGMAHAHDLKIVHRDIKPNNIMLLENHKLGTEGSVKIVDFGIAKYSAREGGEVQALTRTGEIFGSPLYMSPEQCLGGTVDHRSDIYSLGCVMFEALTGTPPFVGENALTTMLKHQTDEPPNFKQLVPEGELLKPLETIIAKMLAKDPNQRYQSLGIVAHELAALKNGSAVGDKPKKKKQQNLAKRGEEKKISITKLNFCALLTTIAILSGAASFSAVWLLRTNKSDAKLAVNTAEKIEDTTPSGMTPVPCIMQIPSSQDLLKRIAVKVPKFQSRYETLTPECIDIIAKARWIQVLDLMNDKIPNDYLSPLATLPLIKLQLSDSELSDKGALEFASMKTLKSFLAARTGVTDRSIRKIATLPLQCLDVSGTKVTDATLQQVGDSKTINWLVINGCQNLTDSGMKLLQTAPIVALEIQNSTITEHGLNNLTKCKSLRLIDLSNTRVMPEDLISFCTNSHIREVFLTDCPFIGSVELDKLHRKFPNINFHDQHIDGKSIRDYNVESR